MQRRPYPPMAYNRGKVELIETSVFTRQITDLLTDEEYRTMQLQLAARPDMGSLIRGAGGVRKVRVGVGSRASVAAPESSIIGLSGRM